MKRAKERESSFKSIPGLLQKYYIKTREKGGVYIWDSLQSQQKYQESDLARSVPSAYAINEITGNEIKDVIFQLKSM